MSAAARVGDPIEHTSALEGLLLGLAVGAAAVVVAAAAGVTIVASGGLAAVAAVGAVMSLSAGVGELHEGPLLAKRMRRASAFVTTKTRRFA